MNTYDKDKSFDEKKLPASYKIQASYKSYYWENIISYCNILAICINTSIRALDVELIVKYKERVILTDSHEKKQEQIPSDSTELEDIKISVFHWIVAFDK